MKHNYPLYLLLLLFLTSCTTVPKLLEKRQFEEAYALAYKLCTRGRAPQPKHWDHYLQAYEAIQASKLYAARKLEKRPGTVKYAKLYELYKGLHARSLDILDVMPSAAKFDRYPELAPATLENKREDARKRAGAHYLALIEPKLKPALSGEKPAARLAWNWHRRVAYFLPERDGEFKALRGVLYDIGTLRILVYAPQGEGDRELDEALHRFKPTRYGWTQLLPRNNGQRIDLEAEITFTDYHDGGYQESCHTREYSEEVLDYIERKKVKERINDSTVVEKVIEIKHYKKVFADVTTCDQSARVTAYGSVSVYQPGKDAPEWRADLSAADTWRNCYSFGRGDSRALPAFANSGRAGRPPALGVMLARATGRLGGAGWQQVSKRFK